LKKINEVIEKKNGGYPEAVLQFGEGNFLRAFADWMIDKANSAGVFRGSIVLCQPIREGMGERLNAQDCVYTLAMRGSENGQPVEKIESITSVSRCINPYEDFEALMEIARSRDLKVVVSNTTEAGISYRAGDRPDDKPPASFPAKVTVFLYERFRSLGVEDSGLLFLPVELIDNNGAVLREIVLQYAAQWGLEEAFITWVKESNCFGSTLVDRIVTGYPRDEADYFADKLGYRDDMLVTSELFNLWVIEGDRKWAEVLPIHKTEANVIWTDDIVPYKSRKVRILNGGHTSTVLAAYLAGHNIVLDFMKDDVLRAYLDKIIFGEIIPTLDLPRDQLEEFAGAVADRFANPYIKHRLLDIALNSCSKFSARCLPSLLGYIERKGQLPPLLCFSFAAFIAFYRGDMRDGKYMGTRPDGTAYPIRDDDDVISFFCDVWASSDTDAVCKAVLSKKEYWGGRDLTEIPGLEKAVAGYLRQIAAEGDIRSVIAGIL